MISRFVFLIIAGIAGGVLGGMGMGGGTLLIPILNLLLDVPQHTAQWINLLAFVPMGIVALIIHIKHKLVEYKKILPILIPAVFTAILSSILATKAPPIVLRQLFGCFLILMGVFSLFLCWLDSKKKKKKED